MILCFLSPAADEELFEDNPEEYIRRDIEGSGILIRAGEYKTFFMLNSTETKIYPAHKC